MRKEDIQEYLSDEALEALIRETEEGPMIKAPEYLEENILDLITSHLRFTDKYFFQSQWEHFAEKRIFCLYLLHDLSSCSPCSNKQQGALMLCFQNLQLFL